MSDVAPNTAATAAAAAEAPVKTAKQLEKEAKKAAKLAKFQEKQINVPKENPKKEAKKEKLKEMKDLAVYTATTAPGEKKDISGTLPDAYSPQYVEAAWYSWWENEGFFKPDYNRPVTEANSNGKFVMIIPPPNVTGSLHLGHAITCTIEDCVTRWHRMCGRTTVWVPGCDHAGIATQVVVEKKLMREQNLSRHDLGREKFIEKVWEWKNEKGSRIYEQFRRMGASVDWSRTFFTMDPNLSKAVIEAFVRMHEDGTIYRSSRLVNWACALRSAISDIEVDKIELSGRTFLPVPGYEEKIEFGIIISFAYKIEDSNEEIVVATTRIETMLGDTAVAVHPNDTRYHHLHGKYCKHPFCDRRIPIIVDEFVEMEFGTGAVKITPAHDPNDYEIGKRHNLPFVTIFDDNGFIVGDYGKFTGMKRFECRKEILVRLKELGLYKDTKPNPMVVPMCSRSKDIIEPMIKPQWYVKSDEMAANAIAAVRSGELKIIPDMHTKLWMHWMENIRDWCISRQLWWGHRIPAYLVTFKNAHLQAANQDVWVVGRNETEALQNATKKFNVTAADITLKQDEDVLDTWFSAALVTFATFGWPDQTDDLQAFYPNNLLETGHDILFFWVARMVFMGQKLLGKLPFKEVFMHPIIRDAHGRKMSKSLGNVIDPMDVISGISLENLNKQLYDSNLDPKEVTKAVAGQAQDFPNGIPECGADAMRFALCSYNLQSRDINLDILRVQGYRFFCNKLWNAVKFALLYFDGASKYRSTGALTGKESNTDLWILSRLALAVENCNVAFGAYDFSAATTALYNFWLYDLCDIYLECLKPVFQSGSSNDKISARQTLFTCLDNGLRLISPFMPYISEELYQRLPRTENGPLSICIAPYPDAKSCPWKNETIEKEFELLQKTAKTIRSARSDYNLTNKTKTEAFVVCSDITTKTILQKFSNDLLTTAYCSKLMFDAKPPNGCAILTITGQCEVHLLLKGLIQVDKELQKLDKKKTQLMHAIEKLNQAMNAIDYTTKVPAEIQQTNKDKLSESEAEINRIVAAMDSLKLMEN